MQKMTQQERIDLGSHLAKTQLLVIRAFRTGLNRAATDSIAINIFSLLTQSNMRQRLQIIEGTELCINLLSERYRGSSEDVASTRRFERIERALHEAVTSAIEKIAEYDHQAAEHYESAPSFAA
jgi:hypothetical protein